MKNYDQSAEISHNPNWPYIPGHPYGILIIGGSGSVKTNGLLNLIKHQRPDIDKVYLYAKDPFESHYQLKGKFSSLLTGKKISEEEYEHVLKIWKKFKMKTMKDYHDLYLK